MAWTIELDQAAVRDVDTLEQQPRRRILAFLHDRVATLDNPRSIGEAITGSTLGEFSGSTGSAITASLPASRTARCACSS